MSTESVLELARKHHEKVVAIRRDIHQHPEIGFEVQRTAGIAAKACRELGFDVREGIGRTGVLADLVVDPAKPFVALRADMDALPMQEKSNATYKSKIDGAAHMCGHDAHTAMLIGAAHILKEKQSELTHNVRLVFQPNEENLPGGAPGMIKDGALENVAMIFGLHVWPEIPTKTLGICVGPAMGQPDEFKMHIQGKGGHAAEPHQAIDPIVIGSQLIVQMQSLIARRVDASEKAVLSFTEFHAGSTHNVIPDTAFLHGTIRTFNPEVQKFLKAELHSQAQALAKSMGGSVEIEYIEGYPVTFNHDSAVKRAQASAAAIFGCDNVILPANPTLGGEDFGYYSQKIPACFSFLGIRNEDKDICYMCHDPRFDVDEDRFVEGMAMHALTALQFDGV